MTKNIINLAEGVTLTVKAEYHEINIDGDIWCETSSVHEKWVSVDFELNEHGNIFKGSDALYHDNADGTSLMVLSNDKHNEKIKVVKLQLKKETTDKVRQAIAEAVATEKPEKMIKEEAEKEEKNRQWEIRNCQEIIKNAEKEGIDKLLTRKELRAWRRNYNNIMNEGGEGFIPNRVSREDYEMAKLKLAELTR